MSYAMPTLTLICTVCAVASQEFVLMFLWYGMGFTLYLAKMPEKLFPKRCDTACPTVCVRCVPAVGAMAVLL
jgi:hypothetical protein